MKLTVATAVLFLGVIGLAILQVNTIKSLHSLEASVVSLQSDQVKMREVVEAEAARLRDSAATAEIERQKALDSVRDEVARTGRQVKGAADKANAEALKSVEKLADHVHSSDEKLRENQDNAARLATEISGLKQATGTTQPSVNAVSTEVDAVKADVATTKNRLDGTIADLRRTTGDMNVMSGLIATNRREIEALRQLGERDYTEFTIYMGKEPVRLADISVLLKKTDVKSSRYTIDLQVGNRKIEKKDRNINEPLQFYTGRDSRLHELVVNQVAKDRIVGYLAISKDPAPRP